MNFAENIRIAFRSVRANLLRAFLTFMIIAFGLMALVGILTAIDSINSSLSSNFSSMGANTFNIIRKGTGIKGGRRGRRKVGPQITYDQALKFKTLYEFPAVVSVSALGTSFGTVKYKNEKTNPNVVVYGGDENYFQVAGYEIEYGRNFTDNEINTGRNVVVIGTEIAKNLFDKKQKAVGSIVNVSNNKYRVIGVLEEKGSSSTFSGDRQVFVPLVNVRQNYGSQTNSYNVSVQVNQAIDMDAAIDEAIGTFRKARNLKLKETDDFEISKSDGLFALLQENTKFIRIATIFVGIITLFGAAIGLMNIMLVSVTERTREIGVCKALGATRKNILLQFLTEAVVICQIGGIVGIILGIMIGNLVSILLDGSFIIPWAWIILGFILCFFVGMVSGLYPAMKASKLDPIESLRYE